MMTGSELRRPSESRPATARRLPPDRASIGRRLGYRPAPLRRLSIHLALAVALLGLAPSLAQRTELPLYTAQGSPGVVDGAATSLALLAAGSFL